MVMQISPEQSDWLSKFLSQNVPTMTPEMAVNTAGSGAGKPQGDTPGIMDRLDLAVNTLGKTIFGDVGHVPGGKKVPAREVAPEPPPMAVPVPTSAGAAPETSAVTPPEEPGFMDRFDGAVNALGKTIFGDVGHVPGGKNVPPREVAPEPPPMAVPVPTAAGAAPAAPPAEEPGFMDRFDGAVNDLGKAIFGDAGH